MSAAISGERTMAWTAPKAKEISCGMEINMYVSSEDQS
ncbi:pyrroloquinoline quinone precursor peptide PqqA [Tateyamaria sp.]